MAASTHTTVLPTGTTDHSHHPSLPPSLLPQLSSREERGWPPSTSWRRAADSSTTSGRHPPLPAAVAGAGLEVVGLAAAGVVAAAAAHSWPRCAVVRRDCWQGRGTGREGQGRGQGQQGGKPVREGCQQESAVNNGH